MPQEEPWPTLRDVKLRPPVTGRGIWMVTLSPVPSSPFEFMPQQ